MNEFIFVHGFFCTQQSRSFQLTKCGRGRPVCLHKNPKIEPILGEHTGSSIYEIVQWFKPILSSISKYSKHPPRFNINYSHLIINKPH